MTFWGFRGAVDRLGCVYTDVDRRYFNDNNPPNGGGAVHATIDVDAGYQKLCGQDALDYVRYRHFDNDLVRAARQQSFLGDAKSQIGVSGVFDDREQLLKIFAQSVRTDIDGTSAILSLLKLVAESSNKPVQEVQFRAEDAGRRRRDDLRDLVAAHRRALPGREGVVGPEGHDAPRRASAAPSAASAARRPRCPPGLVANKTAGEDIGVQLRPSCAGCPSTTPRPWPRAAATSSATRAPTTSSTAPGAPPPGLPHGGLRGLHRPVLRGPGHDLEGPADPRRPVRRPRMRGRRYELFYDGSRLRLVAWRTERGVYWVSNTLLRTLTNRQMLALARSLTRVGAE